MIKNKKTPYLILTLLIIGTLLLVSVGLSIWLITDNVEIKPEFDKDIIVEYLSSKETTYNGNIQLPLAEALNIDEDITEYRYKLVGEENYQVVDRDDSDGTLSGPINAGDYLLEVVYVQYTYEDENGNKVDSTVTVSGIDFKIKQRSLTDEDVSASFTDNNFYYSGFKIEEIETSLNVKYKGKDLVKGTDYTVVFSETFEIGNDHTATITAVDNSNFTDSIEVKYNILPASLEINLNQPAAAKYLIPFGKYNEDTFPLKEWVSVKTLPGGVEVNEYTLSYEYYMQSSDDKTYSELDLSTTTLNVGEYSVKIIAHSSDSNFSDAVKEIILVVDRLDISEAEVIISETPMFDGTAHRPEISSITCNGFNIGIDELGSVSYSNNVHAGTKKAVVTISGDGSVNYEGSAIGYFSIETRPAIINNELSYTITTPTQCDVANFVEGENIEEHISGEASASIYYEDDNGVTQKMSLPGTMKPILTFPDGDSKIAEDVKIKYEFIPSKNINGEYDVAGTTVDSSMLVTLYAVAFTYNVDTSTLGQYYGTVKRAIDAANSSDTYKSAWIIPNIETPTGFYPTLMENATVNSGVTFGLAYKTTFNDDGTITLQNYVVYENKSDASSAYADSNANPARAIIKDNVQLSVYGSLVVGSFVGYDGAVSKQAVLMNNGKIIIQSGATSYSYGFTKGIGSYDLKSGGTIKDVLRVYDFPGARYAAGMYYKTYNIAKQTYNNIFPFNSYSMHNITCELNIYRGSTFTARSQLNISNQFYISELIVFGSGGLFELTENTNLSENYVRRTVENTVENIDINGSWVTSNQNVYQKEVYEFHSNVKDNNITVTMNIVIDIDITTSTQLAMPVGLMKIIIADKCTLTCQANSWRFLPGSEIHVEKGAKIIVSDKVQVIVYDQYYDNYTMINGSGVATSPASFSYYSKHTSLYNTNTKEVLSEYVAKLYVGGTVECLGTGAIAGIIEAKDVSGYIKLTSNNATLKRLASITYLGLSADDILGLVFSSEDFGGVTYDDKQSPQMRLYNGTTINSDTSFVASGEYYAIEDKYEDLGWYSNKLTIGYDLNGGTGTVPSTTPEKNSTGGYLVESGDVPSYEEGNEPTRDYYEYLDKWSLDPEGTEEVIAGETKLYASAIFYAMWKPVDYHITYVNVYYDSADECTNENDVNPNPEIFTVEDKILLRNCTKYDPNGNKLISGGFYTDPLCNDEDRVTDISYDHGDKTIYVYWYPANSNTFTVNYDLDLNNSNISPISSNYDETLESIYNDVLSGTNPELVVIIDGKIEKWNPVNFTTMLNENEKVDSYFEKWYFDSKYQNPCENITYDNIKEYIVSGTLTLYSQLLPKLEVEYQDTEGFAYSSTKPEKFYVVPGQSITLVSGSANNSPFTKEIESYYTYNGFGINSHNDSYENGASVTLDKEYENNKVLITPLVDIDTYYKLTFNNSHTTTTITYTDTNALRESNNNVVASGTSFSDETKTYYGKSNCSFNFSAVEESGYNTPSVDPPEILSLDKAQTITSSAKQNECISAGTLITLADGTLKPVEELLPEDLLLVFNHETGRYEAANIIFVDVDGWKDYRILNLMFSDGYYVKVIYSHGFFDLDLNKYVYIDESNYNEFIGHRFVVTDVIDGKYIEKEVKLEEVYIEIEYTGCYSPVTVYHLNYFTNGLLSMPAGIEGLFNIFEYGEGMKYDEELMKADIEKYGLYTYDDFKDYIPYEIYAAFPAPYLKVAVGKGLITFEEILGLIDKYLGKMLDYK